LAYLTILNFFARFLRGPGTSPFEMQRPYDRDPRQHGITAALGTSTQGTAGARYIAGFR
jgi:hypothetical protein